MFDSELYDISSKAVKNTDLNRIKRENKKLEKNVLEIIKANTNHINENGIAFIRVCDEFKRNKKDRVPYETLRKIIELGQLYYYEEEYSLYLVNNQMVTDGVYTYNTLTFAWNSVDYYQKHVRQYELEKYCR